MNEPSIEQQFFEKAFNDFIFFCEEVLGYKYDGATGFKNFTPKHYELCKFLESKNKRSKLILNPRYSFKSQICTGAKTLFDLVRNPNLRILIYSDTVTKAQGFLQDIKNHVEGTAPNSLFREYFGAWETNPRTGKWNESQIEIAERSASYKEPTVDTGSIDSSKIGMHYDKIIFDDIVSDMNTTTKMQMDKTYDCYKKSLSLLIPKGEIIILGTRWHFGDTYGRILEDNIANKDFEVFLTDAEDTYEDGKLLYEDIGLDQEFLDYQRMKQGSFIYTSLYRNNPVDDETALFKESNFSYYEPSPKFHENFFITGTCDPAGEGEDCTAITIVGMDKDHNMYVLDALNDHISMNGIIDHIIRLSYKWKFNRFGIEKNFFKGELEKQLRQEINEQQKNKLFTPFSVEEIVASSSRRTFTRVLGLQTYQERKKIYLPARNFNALNGVYRELAFQMLQFTMDGSKSPHDDLIVSLAMHPELLVAGGDPKEEGPPPTSAAAFELEQVKSLRAHNRRVPLKYRKNLTMAFND